MTRAADVSTDRVGPVLEANDAGRALVEAIRKTNPGAFVQDRGSYLRVLVAGGCTLTRAAAEAELGRPFRLPGDLEQLMPSFKGTLRITREEASWSWSGEQ
jgi:MmoB/DmpM family protein